VSTANLNFLLSFLIIKSSLNFSQYDYPLKSTANYVSKHTDFRHNNTANVLFMDSHVESFKQEQLYGTGEKYILSQKP